MPAGGGAAPAAAAAPAAGGAPAKGKSVNVSYLCRENTKSFLFYS